MNQTNIFDALSGNEFLMLSKTLINNLGVCPAYIFAVLKAKSDSQKHFDECPNVVITKSIIENLEEGVGTDWKENLKILEESNLIRIAHNEWDQIVIKWPHCDDCKNCSKGYKE